MSTGATFKSPHPHGPATVNQHAGTAAQIKQKVKGKEEKDEEEGGTASPVLSQGCHNGDGEPT